LLFGADDSVGNRKHGNHSDDTSDVHLQKVFEETATVAGIWRKLPRNFCEAKPTNAPVVCGTPQVP
jgi:hypothetical protein